MCRDAGHVCGVVCTWRSSSMGLSGLSEDGMERLRAALFVDFDNTPARLAQVFRGNVVTLCDNAQLELLDEWIHG